MKTPDLASGKPASTKVQLALWSQMHNRHVENLLCMMSNPILAVRKNPEWPSEN
jgi:hypothetical protein